MTHHLHLAHGLAGDELPPDWPALTGDEVSAVLARFPVLGPVQAITWRSPRPLSAAALVRTTTGQVFVKRHHASVRTTGSLSEEHRFAAHLRAHGVPVPMIHTNAQGETALASGEWVYEVHAPAQGRDLYRDAFSWSPVGGTRHAFEAGAMLARLHGAARGYEAPQRDTTILVARADIVSAADPVALLEATLAQRPALARYLQGMDWRASLRGALAPWHACARDGIVKQSTLWTHGDWHVSNLCWSGAGDDARVTDVLDFGLCAATFALFDIATAIERNAIAWLEIERGDIGRADLTQALLDGYHHVLPLSQDDRAVIADLLPVVHVDFALSEVEYFEGVTRRRDHADVAWHTFLVGHAAWFGTTHGQHLLQAIRHTPPGFVFQ